MDPARAPFVQVDAATEEIVTTILAGSLVALFLGGVTLVQFMLLFRQLVPRGDDEEGQARRARLRSTAKWKLTTATTALLFVTWSFDTAIKATDIILYVRRSLLHGVAGVVNLPHLAIGVTMVEGFLAMIVQLSYTVRLAVIWPHGGLKVKLGVAFSVACACVQFAGSIWTGVLVQNQPLYLWAKVMTPGVVMWWGTACVNDIFLCAAFCWHIQTLRTGFAKTDDIISQWIAFTLETGLLSTAVQITSLVLFIGWSERGWMIATALVLADVYLNSILIVFRTLLAGGMHSSASNSVIPASIANTTTQGTTGGWRGQRGAASEVVISTEYAQEEDRIYEMPDRKPALRTQEKQGPAGDGWPGEVKSSAGY